MIDAAHQKLIASPDLSQRPLETHFHSHFSSPSFFIPIIEINYIPIYHLLIFLFPNSPSKPLNPSA